MSMPARRRKDRLEVRLTAESKALLAMAAAAENKSISAYVLDAGLVAAAEALAAAAPDGGMDPECILPTMIEWEVYAKEAVAVGMKAQEQGIARLTFTADELFDHAAAMILRSRRLTEVMMETGLIAEPPEE